VPLKEYKPLSEILSGAAKGLINTLPANKPDTTTTKGSGIRTNTDLPTNGEEYLYPSIKTAAKVVLDAPNKPDTTTTKGSGIRTNTDLPTNGEEYLPTFGSVVKDILKPVGNYVKNSLDGTYEKDVADKRNVVMDKRAATATAEKQRLADLGLDHKYNAGDWFKNLATSFASGGGKVAQFMDSSTPEWENIKNDMNGNGYTPLKNV
jgi:hypothetical protein